MRANVTDPALDGYPALIPAKTVAQEILFVSPRTMRRWIADGRVTGVLRTSPTGGRVLIRREGVARLLAELEGHDVA